LARLPRILLADLDRWRRAYIRRSLAVHGFELVGVANGAAVLRILTVKSPSIVILGAELPDRTVPSLIRSIRSISSVPILVLTPDRSAAAIMAVLDNGADDCVSTPFSIEELAARIRKLLRYSLRKRGKPVYLMSGDLAIDLVMRRLYLEGRELHVSAKQYDVLRLMAEANGAVVRHEDIAHLVWGKRRADPIHNLRRVILELRRLIEKDPGAPTYIQTETRIGYRLALLAPTGVCRPGHEKPVA
jgi:two-component system, OmpR family, KDP operon response regulator KdpE